MEDKNPKEYFDERTGLWYSVKWDDKLQCYAWTLAPHQKQIVDSA